ncbi:MAG: sodium-dependent bicarbonate transport family permease, partial [Bacteroidota bacterium]
FKGIVCLFLLEVGLVAGRRLGDLKKAGLKLLVMSLAIPVLNAFAAAWVAHLCGLSQGGAVIFSVLCASASYIAAPAAVRIALPEANPGYYLTASLAITFPFNVTLGIPLYMQFVEFMYK